MKKLIILGIIVLSIFIVIGVINLKKDLFSKTTVINNVIEREIPIFRLESYQINHSGRIYSDGTDSFFSLFETGGWKAVSYFEAKLLIGTDFYPKMSFSDNTITLDFSEVVLTVSAVHITKLELDVAQTSGWRWFRGGGIPIQEGLFNPILDMINSSADIFNKDEEILQKALDSMIVSYKKFYSGLGDFEFNIIKGVSKNPVQTDLLQ